MNIINCFETHTSNTLIAYLPKCIRASMYNISFDSLEEIRLRVNSPVQLIFRDKAAFLSGNTLCNNPSRCRCIRPEDIAEAVSLITDSSVYALQNQISQGYITLPGGHRVGICGTAVSDGNGIDFIKNIHSLNYRFAKEIPGCSDDVLPKILCGNNVRNTLIISPPQCGKTTLLRDIVRAISDSGIKVGIVDEKSEIAALNNSVPGFNIGMNTDVLDNSPKDIGINILLRNMSPQVIAVDELGKSSDISAVQNAIYSGVNVIATAHASDKDDLLNRFDMQHLQPHFGCIITLSKRGGSGNVEEVYIR